MIDDGEQRNGGARSYLLNMPQMALCGLSETWLFKELGDIHWSMITGGLQASTSELEDEAGSRLYATFCRVCIESSAPLSAFSENEEAVCDGEITRYGQGVFFSNIGFTGDNKNIRATIMSSFAKRRMPGSNVNLVKAGLPVIPDECPIEKLTELPTFGIEYNDRRNQAPGQPLFERDYKINPYQDINGVGLLYFASYQSISDICELEYIGEGNRWAEETSTIKRDVYYFANSDINEKLIYRVLHRRDFDSSVEIESSISRSSDGVVMAYVITRKALIGGRAVTTD
jgi:probable biosynthetic protein (TIGR04098 family)